ncbi:MAG: hypothetical protein IJG36_04420 [Synergistaceae bacterium]|nr:hypothetical protein [Synergistaceae bacterium]
MWNGSSWYRGGKYHNAPEVKRQRQRITAVLDGAFASCGSVTPAPPVIACTVLSPVLT